MSTYRYVVLYAAEKSQRLEHFQEMSYMRQKKTVLLVTAQMRIKLIGISSHTAWLHNVL